MPFNIKFETNETKKFILNSFNLIRDTDSIGVSDNCSAFKMRPNKGRHLKVRGPLKEVQSRIKRPNVESALFFMEVTCGENKSLA